MSPPSSCAVPPSADGRRENCPVRCTNMLSVMPLSWSSANGMLVPETTAVPASSNPVIWTVSTLSPGSGGSEKPASAGRGVCATVVASPFALMNWTMSEVGCGLWAKPSSGPVTMLSVPVSVVEQAAAAMR